MRVLSPASKPETSPIFSELPGGDEKGRDRRGQGDGHAG
jgi:hypothetical protein